MHTLHMLRDTFAVEMLVAGLSLEEVSILLGDRSTRITKSQPRVWPAIPSPFIRMTQT
jgi:site-specific recombinase XerD